jgi:glyoxylase-like metal-dependent hydrolase (beta-lactamase superfamily II)
MSYRHHLDELSAANLNLNPEHALQIASEAVVFIREERLRRLVFLGLDGHLLVRLKELEQRSIRYVNMLRAGTEMLSGQMGLGQPGNGVEESLAEHRRELVGLLGDLKAKKPAHSRTAVEDLSYYSFFLAAIWQSVGRPHDRRTRVPQGILRESMAFSRELCVQAIEFDRSNWPAWRHLVKAARIQERERRIWARTEATQERSEMAFALSTLLEGLATCRAHLTSHATDKSVTDDAEFSAVELGRLLNGIGRTFEVHFIEPAQSSLDELEELGFSPEQVVERLTIYLAPEFEKWNRPAADARTVLSRYVAKLTEAEGRLQEWFESTAEKLPEKVKYESFKKELGTTGRGLLLAYLAFDVAEQYLKDLPVEVLGRALRDRLLRAEPGYLGLQAPLHNKARILTALSLQLRKDRPLDRLGFQAEFEAIELFRRAIEIEPRYAIARENYALLLQLRGEYAEAALQFHELEAIYRVHQGARHLVLNRGMGAILTQQRIGEERLKAYLNEVSIVDGDTSRNSLVVLKRWNSYSPSLPTKDRALGGGYLLTLGGIGIAVDPGFSFLKNLDSAGFALLDVSHVLITHLHSDHCHDLEDLLMLRYEIGKRHNHDVEPLHIWASERVHNALKARLDSDTAAGLLGKKHELHIVPAYPEVTPLKPGPHKGNIALSATPVLHCSSDGDHEKSVASGFRVDFQGDSAFSVGFTGDTATWGSGNALAAPFKDVIALVAHLGRVYRGDILTLNSFCEVNLPDADVVVHGEQRNHLGYAGVCELLDKVAGEGAKPPELYLLSEFGEELGEYRLALASHLQRRAHRQNVRTCVAAADTGQVYWLPSAAVNTTESVRFQCPLCGGGCERHLDELVQAGRGDGTGDMRIVNHCVRHISPVRQERRIN